MLRGIFVLIAIFTTAHTGTAVSQDEAKAEIVINNFRDDTLSLKYDYVFRDFSWSLMTYVLQPEGELTYRRPANLPGCKQLRDWGIDKGRFVISAGEDEVCSGPLSICDTTNYNIEVHDGGCKWNKAQ